jgi:hypothetical protein
MQGDAIKPYHGRIVVEKDGEHGKDIISAVLSMIPLPIAEYIAGNVTSQLFRPVN